MLNISYYFHLNHFPFSVLIRIPRIKIAVYVEKVPLHYLLLSLPDLTVNDKEHNLLKSNEVPF